MSSRLRKRLGCYICDSFEVSIEHALKHRFAEWRRQLIEKRASDKDQP